VIGFVSLTGLSRCGRITAGPVSFFVRPVDSRGHAVDQVVELKRSGSGWLLTINGVICGSSVTRDVALGLAAMALRRRFPDPAALAAIEFRGLALTELLPARPTESCPLPLPSKIDFAEARQRVAQHWLPTAAARVRTPVTVADELCVEYEWGWVVHWRPIEPEKGDPRFVNEYHFPYLADRVTGNTGLSGGTRGIERGIIELLQQRPPELCGPYPPGAQDWLIVIDAFEAAGAFTPLRPGRCTEREEAESGAAPTPTE
jgi:hypothetical protein